MKVVLITHHAIDGDRKTGFHFWADILARRGHSVRWMTVGFSRVTALKKNARKNNPPYNKWVQFSDNIQRYVWCPLFHPVDLGNRLLNLLSWPVFALYPKMMPKNLLSGLEGVDFFIVESGAGIVLVPRLAKLFPNARFLYNFSDRYSVIKYHPIIPHTDRLSLPLQDAIRVNATASIADFPPDAPVQYIPQAIEKRLFDNATVNPYPTGQNAISIGDMQFDAHAIEVLAKEFPTWKFHIFGRKAKLETPLPNVIVYGEFAMEKLIPYIKFADIGLAPYSHSEDCEYLSESSLKLVQYTYCSLPIVAPKFASIGRAHVIPYDSSRVDETIGKAFYTAMAYDRGMIDRSSILNWEEMLAKMISTIGDGNDVRQMVASILDEGPHA